MVGGWSFGETDWVMVVPCFFLVGAVVREGQLVQKTDSTSRNILRPWAVLDG